MTLDLKDGSSWRVTAIDCDLSAEPGVKMVQWVMYVAVNETGEVRCVNELSVSDITRSVI